MSNLIPALAAFFPVALVCMALHAATSHPSKLSGATRLAVLTIWLQSAFAAAAAVSVFLFGSMQSGVLGVGSIGFSIRLDPLSTIILMLVSFVGAIVVGYSSNYLAGEVRQSRFVGGLCVTIAAVTFLVIAGNLFQLVLAWVATSIALQRLLLFYGERPAAVIAARKKFIVARLGDACLILAGALLVVTFDTFDLATLLEAVRARSLNGETPGVVSFAAMLIAGAAILKSAQFPTNGWLLEVMETPTPVSALLHAGIINAGGFLVIRLADVVSTTPLAMYTLAVVGGITALIGSLVMVTQTSVKVSLAWSTVAQMGFMLLQCGLGAFSAAVLHIVAHSLYKAHAFLSAGSVVTASKMHAKASKNPRDFSKVVFSIFVPLLLLLVVAVTVDFSVIRSPSTFVFEIVMLLGLSQLLASASYERELLPQAIVSAVLIVAAYTIQHALFAHFLSPTLPPQPAFDGVAIFIVAVALIAVPLVILIPQLAQERSYKPFWQSLYVHFRNGFYANAYFNHLVGGYVFPRNK